MYLQFQLVQHIRDEILLKSLEQYLNCGKVYSHSAKALTFTVSKFSDIQNNIIPFLKKYPIIGSKSKDFEDFCKGAELIKNKVHLTETGLEQLRQIKSGMNTGRI